MICKTILQIVFAEKKRFAKPFYGSEEDMQLTFEKDEVILKFPRDLLSEGYVQDFFQRLRSEISPETGIPEDIRKKKEYFLDSVKKHRFSLPPDYRFDREELHER